MVPQSVTGTARYIVFDLPDRMGRYIVENDQTLRFGFLVLTLLALGIEFWCDLLWFVNMRGEGICTAPGVAANHPDCATCGAEKLWVP